MEEGGEQGEVAVLHGGLDEFVRIAAVAEHEAGEFHVAAGERGGERGGAFGVREIGIGAGIEQGGGEGGVFVAEGGGQGGGLAGGIGSVLDEEFDETKVVAFSS